MRRDHVPCAAEALTLAAVAQKAVAQKAGVLSC
jgi:hypothetical protein